MHAADDNACNYSELHCLSNFSFLRGASHPHELVEQAMALGYRALAITDECSVAGVVRAYAALQQATPAKPFKLIIGSEFACPELGTVVLLAQHRRGYGQLCQLITQARQRAAKGHYRVTMADFDGQQLDDCLLLLLPQADLTAATLSQLQEHWQQRLWLLYERHYTACDAEAFRHLQGLHELTGVAVVAAGGVRMHCRERQPLLDTLTAIREHCVVEQAVAQMSANAERHLRSLQRLQNCYPARWLANTEIVSERCQFCLSELSYQYPSELVPEELTASEYLAQLCQQGAQKRYPEGVPASVQATLDKELTLVASLGYEYFFLTIYDIVQFAERQGILYQGRGSAANSVICYCLHITAVNPAQMQVLFERFLSKERNEPPDIDVDFEHQRREEVIQYIYQKYGRERAALAATVISYRLKSAFRDVGKALGFTEQQLQYFLRQIDRRDRQADWQQQLLQRVPSFAEHPRGRWLLELVQQIRGFPRHLSQHVGGFVISAGPLHHLVPIENAAMTERTVIQWDKDDLETLKLLKVDVLALGMLTALRKMLSGIAKRTGQTLALADIPAEDAAVYNMLQHADSIGIFQIESRAQMNMLPRLRPKTFYDLVIQIAIVRPGPIQGDMVHPYLRRRHGEEAVDYPSEEVAGVLTRTLGVPIFQEQVIKLAMVAAGFSGGEADQLRRAMASWKSTGKLRPFRDKLIDGMTTRGYPAEFAERLYQQICGFGEYGFPESHSASFANLAYASAWVKYHYPAEFYVGLLNSLPMGFYSASQLLQDARRHGIHLLPACINLSQWDYQVEVTAQQRLAIRLGLRQVKGVSRERMQQALQQRPAMGFQYRQQLLDAGCSRHDIERLATADALTQLYGNRHQASWQTMGLSDEQLPLFALAEPSTERVQAGDNRLTSLPAPDEMQDISADYRYLGATVRRHPLALLREQGRLHGCLSAHQLKSCRHQQVVTVAGLITCRQHPGTKTGVTFLTLEDETGNMNVVLWQTTARQFRLPYLTAKLLQVTGVFECQGEVRHIIAGRLMDLSDRLPVAQVRSRDFH
ncbi:error-prone DNA polymerase [Idiomarina xiamenensis]|uniref:Error-prone DNA polymerase n=1 Tax=Idiomarina xiamenensis 10-D-4 TaxID=740709 RepID=K2KPA9_9GAMM|nr:error-prone DNA polymerase [Idiomarina xiamenensis]EKE79400.1 DNA polymerase III subunit alpha [Idiomarina xiamenensis 10-D-4]